MKVSQYTPHIIQQSRILTRSHVPPFPRDEMPLSEQSQWYRLESIFAVNYP